MQQDTPEADHRARTVAEEVYAAYVRQAEGGTHPQAEQTYQDGAGKGRRVFVDGGLWANNPVLVGLIDALDMTEPGQEVQIFCLGTCPMPAGERIPPGALDRGLGEWKFGGKAAELSIDAQQFAYDHMAMKIARHVGRPCTIVRFPSQKVPATLLPYLGLDDTREEAMDALVDQARTDADMTNSRCAYRSSDPEAGARSRCGLGAPSWPTSNGRSKAG